MSEPEPVYRCEGCKTVLDRDEVFAYISDPVALKHLSFLAGYEEDCGPVVRVEK